MNLRINKLNLTQDGVKVLEQHRNNHNTYNIFKVELVDYFVNTQS